MKMIGFAFVCIMIKLLFDDYHNDIIGPEQVCLALICSFFCGVFWRMSASTKAKSLFTW